ncbi:hypothetical protein [Massilia sp. Leaf139]|uniref:hypothetical protein n=1 Tax=Massilia sp. Leaf139 TaxID=1736272 RepID=UPI0006FD45CF|nr:hypothetical protein [Massilia sp. Leaf139]KQQ96578.1 hypothetical protein ASF77_00810 [Massilia sp. Leaf139]
MKKRIKSVSLVQNAKMMAALYLVLSLPLLAVMAVFGSVANQAGMSLVAMVTFAVAYVVSGFVFTLIGALVYNLVASFVGGFEFTAAEVTHN